MATRRPSPDESERYHGILNLDKPRDWTSHDVVAKVRRILGQRSVGHAGTLDPLATGVLLVCVGRATRVAEYLMAGQKVYRAVARLGATTTTYDSQGELIAEARIPKLSRQGVLAALARYVGDIQQTPPAYSAVKQDGVPAYRKARKGETVELAPRPVTIHRIDLLSWSAPHLTIEVTCSPGTYIRSLVHDLGQDFGCGAILIQLTRLRSGQFSLEDAIDLDELAAAAQSGQVERVLQPLEAALGDLERVDVDAEAVARLAVGQPIACPTPPTTSAGYARTSEGVVAAILAYDGNRQQWRPNKVFVADDRRMTGG